VYVVVEVVVNEIVVVEVTVDVINIVDGCGLVTKAAQACVSTCEPNGIRSRGVTVTTGATVTVRLPFLLAATTANVVTEVVADSVVVVVARTVMVVYPRYPVQKLCKCSAMMMPSAALTALVLIMDTTCDVTVTMFVTPGSVVVNGCERVVVRVLTDTTTVFEVWVPIVVVPDAEMTTVLVCGGGGITTNMHACMMIDGPKGNRSVGVGETTIGSLVTIIGTLPLSLRTGTPGVAGLVVKTVDVPVAVVMTVVMVATGVENDTVTGFCVVTVTNVCDPTTIVWVTTGVKVEKPVVEVLVVTVLVVV